VFSLFFEGPKGDTGPPGSSGPKGEPGIGVKGEKGGWQTNLS